MLSIRIEYTPWFIPLDRLCCTTKSGRLCVWEKKSENLFTISIVRTSCKCPHSVLWMNVSCRFVFVLCCYYCYISLFDNFFSRSPQHQHTKLHVPFRSIPFHSNTCHIRLFTHWISFCNRIYCIFRLLCMPSGKNDGKREREKSMVLCVTLLKRGGREVCGAKHFYTFTSFPWANRKFEDILTHIFCPSLVVYILLLLHNGYCLLNALTKHTYTRTYMYTNMQTHTRIQ